VFRATVDVVFVTSEGRQTFRTKLTERQHSFVYFLPDKPKMVQFDPGMALLKSLDFTKPKDLLIYQLEHDEDSVGRIEAAEGLAKHTAPEAIEALKKAVMSDAFWGVQAAAARALGEIRSDAARAALIECTKVEHPKARRAVATALGKFKEADAAEALADLLHGDPSYYVAASAASALGSTKWEQAHETLVAALDRESHMDVIRSGALTGLADLKTDEARSIATLWTEYGRPQRARMAATAALGKLGTEHKPTTERLQELLDDPWFQVRLSAVGSLVQLKDATALPALRRMADREIEGRTVRRAREAITAIREGRNAPDDVKKLRDDLTKVEDENRSLRDRLDRLEQRLNGRQDETGSDGARSSGSKTSRSKKTAAKKS
jgi:aminopeptidase N